MENNKNMQEKFIEQQTKVVKLMLKTDSPEPKNDNDSHFKAQTNPKEAINSTNEIAMNRNILVLNNLITLDMYKTLTLSEIIQYAKLCLIHPSLTSTSELRNNFRDIKVSLSAQAAETYL